MKLKLILSAFAMSLIVLVLDLRAQTESIDDFIGLEDEILPDIFGPHRFTKKDLHHNKEWNIDEDKVITDLKEPIKGQNYSIIPWSEIDPVDWLSIDSWMAERSVKDRMSEWKIKLRKAYHKELLGKVLQCKGTCSVYRGSSKSTARHLSKIYEGDEFQTEENSIAWIFLVDGTLIRLSPKTSITTQEINISSKEIYIFLRLNFGHIFWSARSGVELDVDYSPETDSVSLPLMVREANKEFFERDLYKNQSEAQKFLDILNLNDLASEKQFEKLNHLITENNPEMRIPTKAFIVTPNMNLLSINQSFDLIYLFSGKSYFKKRTTNKDLFSISLRGYSSKEASNISESEWHEVDPNGSSYVKIDEISSILQILELLTKRIKTIELAREIWIKKFTLPVLKSILNPEELATMHGFILWKDELETRQKFLEEYTRRVETTYLRSMENILVNEGNKKQLVGEELSEKLFQTSLNDYLLGVKSRYDKEKLKVKEMNDLHYYIWILRNGKF
jgi:hypothetical protein